MIPVAATRYLPSTVARRPAERRSSSGYCRGRNASTTAARAYGEAAAGRQGRCSCRQQHKASLRSLPMHSSFRQSAGLARRQASVGLRAETSEVASACGCGWPQFLTSLGRCAPRIGQPHPCEARGQRRRDPAEGGGQDRRRAAGGRGRRAGSIRPSTADTSSPPTRRDRRAASATRTAAPSGPPTAEDRCRRTGPNGRITTALVDPDGSGSVTEAIPTRRCMPGGKR